MASFRLSADFPRIEFQSDDKHIEDDAKLRDGLQRSDDLSVWITGGTGNQPMHRFRADCSQK